MGIVLNQSTIVSNGAIRFDQAVPQTNARTPQLRHPGLFLGLLLVH